MIRRINNLHVLFLLFVDKEHHSHFRDAEERHNIDHELHPWNLVFCILQILM